MNCRRASAAAPENGSNRDAPSGPPGGLAAERTETAVWRPLGEVLGPIRGSIAGPKPSVAVAFAGGIWHSSARCRRVRRQSFGCGCSSVVEHDLAKVGVEGSSPFARSRNSKMAEFDEGPLTGGLFVLGHRSRRPLVGCIAFGPFDEFSDDRSAAKRFWLLPRLQSNAYLPRIIPGLEEISSQMVRTQPGRTATLLSRNGCDSIHPSDPPHNRPNWRLSRGVEIK